MSVKPFPDIGKNIKNLRSSLKLSLEELSIRSGISKGMISQIEQNKTNPTLLSVWKISNALSIPFQKIIDLESEIIFEPQPKQKTLTMSTPDGKCKMQFLTPVHYIDKLELYMLNFEKDGSLENFKGHPPRTEEIFKVIKGKFKVQVQNRSAILKPGDSIRYSVDLEHHIYNISKGPAEAILVVKFNT